MANTKISALTSATTPLAGTEVLPIVQSSATVKVATNDLTVRNVRANATTGILQVTGPAAASTRVMTVPDANFTAARTDAAQSFTGDQTLSTGNLVVSNGKGIDFSATPGTGTSELFADYEEGTWTPAYVTTGGSFTYSSQSGTYVKIGRMVYVTGWLATSAATVGTGAVTISGLPYTTNASASFRGGSGAIGYSTGFSVNAPTALYWTEGNTSVNLQYNGVGATSNLASTNLTTGASGNFIFFAFSYPT